jgi:hypothetical protein
MNGVKLQTLPRFALKIHHSQNPLSTYSVHLTFGGVSVSIQMNDFLYLNHMETHGMQSEHAWSEVEIHVSIYPCVLNGDTI